MVASSLAMAMLSCSGKEHEYDATGTFEAVETTVSAEESGRLLKFGISEGDVVLAGSEVGLIDTMQIWLKIRQSDAVRAVYASQKQDVLAQTASLRQQLQKA